MEYTVAYDPAQGICTVRVTGRVQRPRDSMMLQQLARDIDENEGYQQYLFDMRQAQIIGGTVDAYQAGTVPVDRDRRQGRHQVALVYRGDLADHKFMETVAVNRGYVLRVFDDYDEAVAWLSPNPQPDLEEGG